MDPAYTNKKIVDLSEAELIALGFLGDDVAPDVKDYVEKVRADPENLGFISCFMIDCLKCAPPKEAPAPSEAEILYSELRNDPSAHTVVAPDLISKYEQNFWYHGISGNPPQLMWRSDFDTNPFPIPPPGTEFSKIPAKTIHGVFNSPLKDVWHTVAPLINASIKVHGLKCSVLNAVRFWTAEDGQDETPGPVVVWIAVHPNTTTPGAVRDATPDILRILSDAQINDVVVEWYEGSVVRL